MVPRNKDLYLEKMFAGEWQEQWLTEPDAGSLVDGKTSAEDTEEGIIRLKGKNIHLPGDTDTVENTIHMMLAESKAPPVRRISYLSFPNIVLMRM